MVRTFVKDYYEYLNGIALDLSLWLIGCSCEVLTSTQLNVFLPFQATSRVL